MDPFIFAGDLEARVGEIRANMALFVSMSRMIVNESNSRCINFNIGRQQYNGFFVMPKYLKETIGTTLINIFNELHVIKGYNILMDAYLHNYNNFNKKRTFSETQRADMLRFRNDIQKFIDELHDLWRLHNGYLNTNDHDISDRINLIEITLMNFTTIYQ